MNDGIYDAWQSEQRLAKDEKRIAELLESKDVKEYLELKKSLNDFYESEKY
jgi:hypothetical protein